MSESNLLKFIKEMGLSHDDVIEMLKTNTKILKTREEIREDIEKEMARKKELEQKALEEAKAKEEAEKEEEGETDDIKKQLADLTKEIKELKATGITRKKPSAGQRVDEENLPESVTYTIQRNMFETDV